MNKAELAEEVAGRVGLTKKETSNVVDAITSAITDTLARNERVTLVGFGRFEVRRRKARTGVNSQTRERLDIPAKAGSYLGYYSHLLVRAVDYVRVPYPSVEAPEFYRFAKALVWERRVLFGGSSKDAWGQLENILTETMGRFAADYRHDNPGSTKGE